MTGFAVLELAISVDVFLSIIDSNEHFHASQRAFKSLASSICAVASIVNLSIFSLPSILSSSVLISLMFSSECWMLLLLLLLSLLASHSSLRHFTACFRQSSGPGTVATSVVVILT